MVFVGLDLHKRYITGCAVAADGTVLGEVRRVAPTWEALAMWLARFGSELTVVLEATLYCWWLERQLTGGRPRCTLDAALTQYAAARAFAARDDARVFLQLR
jgi:hypothetical protein